VSKRKFGAGALLIHVAETGDRYTLIQQRALDDEYEPGTWTIYGGMSEIGERPVETMVREVDEEASINVEGLHAVPVFTMEDWQNSFEFHTFAVRLPRMVRPVHSRETNDACWIKLGATPETLWQDLPRPLHSGMLPLIQNRTVAALIDTVAR
jgi:8-oxo-dGTP pyrophosphatase MutT (NUDIX family)